MKYLIMILLFLSATMCPAQKLRLQDSQKREILLEKAPQSIIITGRAGFMISNLAFLFQSASERLISYSRNFQFRNADKFYGLIDAKFSLRPEVNEHNIGIEEIAAMKPDLVMAREVERNRLEKGLSRLGIPVVFFNLERPEIFFREIRLLGMIFSEPERAEKISSFFLRWQKFVESQIEKSEAKSRKPKVLHLFYSEREGPVSFSVSPPHWIQARIVVAAGGLPVWTEFGAAKGWKKVGFEQIAAWNPDYILVSSYFSDVEAAVEKLKGNPLWQKLAAVKNNRLFAFPEDYVCWDQPDTRWILGQVWLAGILNPEVRALKNELPNLVREFFEMYGLSPEQIKIIPIHGDYN